MKEIIRTKDAILKPVAVEDAVELFRLIDRHRHDLREWLPWIDASVDVENTIEFITQANEQQDRNQGIQFGIWHQGKLAGVIGVHRIDWVNGKTEIGYWLAAPFQGKGLMTAAVQAYLDFLIFGKWGLNRVEIRAAAENRKSRAIPERLGFRLEGMLRHNEYLYGRYVDHAVYGMLAEEWKRNRSEDRLNNEA